MTFIPERIRKLGEDYITLFMAGATEEEILGIWSLNELDAQSAKVITTRN